VAGQMGNRGLVDTTTSVDVDSVDHLVSGLRVSLTQVLILVLSRRCQQQASIWGKSKTSEEGRQCLVGVEVGILHSQTTAHG
jgi:hypothetical protein